MKPFHFMPRTLLTWASDVLVPTSSNSSSGWFTVAKFCTHRAACRSHSNGLRQLLQGQGRHFSKSCCLAAAGEGDTTSQTSQQSAEEEESSSQFESDAREQEEYDARQKILQASLPFVHQHGWTKKAIAAGAETEGFSSVSHGMFPRGGAELVHFFYATCNKDLAAILAERVQQQQGEQKPPTREFIRDALETRLRMIVPYVDTWPQAMAVQTLPQNALESWTNLRNLMDDIWYYAGDRSVDFNWYTKRASLAGVYKATEIYMLQDRSEDNADTWDFMDRRLQDLQFLAKNVRNASQMGTVLTEGLWGMCIMGRNVLGMNPRNR